MFLTALPWILAGICLVLAMRERSARRAMEADLTKEGEAIRDLQSTRSELVSAVTHEIRTPLTCLLGYTQMLLENDFPRDRQITYLTVISRETHRLNSFLTDFLEIQFIESTGRLQLRPGQMADPLRETFELFKNQRGPHRFVLEPGKALPVVNMDDRRIRQVLSNLISNAVKYSPAGGSIRLGASVRGDDLVVFVQDEGIGIPESALPRLFDKFFRVHGEQTGDIPGSGLGLALVRECVKAHGGAVWVDSVVGQGSTFFFSLPVIPDQTAASEGELKTSTPHPAYSKR